MNDLKDIVRRFREQLLEIEDYIRRTEKHLRGVLTDTAFYLDSIRVARDDAEDALCGLEDHLEPTEEAQKGE